MQLQELLAQAHDVMTIKTSLRGAHREERDRRDSSGECSSAARAAAVVSRPTGESAEGGGFGLWATPAGVYVIKGETSHLAARVELEPGDPGWPDRRNSSVRDNSRDRSCPQDALV